MLTLMFLGRNLLSVGKCSFSSFSYIPLEVLALFPKLQILAALRKPT